MTLAIQDRKIRKAELAIESTLGYHDELTSEQEMATLERRLLSVKFVQGSVCQPMRRGLIIQIAKEADSDARIR